jgi:sporulation protein YlmC with PRC-barrel domain
MHELNIFTNDGWVVTLVSDEEIYLGDAILSTIIVQPKEAYNKRVVASPNTRKAYRLNIRGEVNE